MPIQIDTSSWPIWLTVALLILNLFKEQLAPLLPAIFKEKAKREAKQEEREAKEEEYKRLNSAWVQEQLLEILKQNQEWTSTDFGNRLGSIEKDLTHLQNSVGFNTSLLKKALGLNGETPPPPKQ